ncbi:MAG: nitroreductase [Myxococcales bacterium]|nr:nitroreductase [Myxococcales bacterium]
MNPPLRDEPAVEAMRKHLLQRKSVRGYRPEPLTQAQLTEWFELAQRAASWCNIQPWRVVVTMPPLTQIVADEIVSCAKAGLPNTDVSFPLVYPEPYATHRRQCGGALYGAMGVARDDKEGRLRAWMRNYEIFGAPHVAIVSVDKRLGAYANLDIGIWLGMLMMSASALGIDMCAMAVLAHYPQALRKHLPISPDEAIIFGIAIGYEDTDVAANACRTTRSPVSDNVQFVATSTPYAPIT